MSNVTNSTKALIGALLAGSVGIIIFLFVRLSDDPRRSIEIGTPKAAAACAKGDNCMPDVKFVDTHGTVYSRAELTGKVVVVNFWATWCKPCQREIPAFSRIYDKYKERGVIFLGVLTGDNADASTLLNFQSDNEMTYPVVRATQELQLEYNDDMANLPTTLVYDRGGKQVLRRVGGLNDQKLAEMLEPLVAQKI